MAFPSFYMEGLPKSCIDAEAAGLPIITTDWVGCRDTVIDAQSMFIRSIILALQLGGAFFFRSSVILTYLMAFAKVNDIHLTAPELIKLAIDEERNYIGVNVGKLD